MKDYRYFLTLIPLLLILLISGNGTFSSGTKTLTEAELKAKWKTVEDLEKKQQYNAAVPVVEEILTCAREKADAPLWTKALVRRVVLENVLHGYETSIRLLLDNQWPKDVTSQALLNLYTANTLFSYYQAYSWEINRREKIASQLPRDLKAWTAQDLFQAVNERFALAWKQRDLLGRKKISDFPDYFRTGNYPGKIRKTLRDFLVYQWVDFLENTTTWRPEELQEKYKLSLAEFTKWPPAKIGEINFKEPGLHPLQKIGYLLNEHYHSRRGDNDRESCLEAMLVKVGSLIPHFTKENEKEEIAKAYRVLLREYEGISWWAHGQYLYASFIQGRGDAVTAHQLAKTGYEKYPDSVGGKECFALLKEIEAPAFSMMVMDNDRSNTGSIQLTHTNLNRLYLRAYRMDLKLSAGADYRTFDFYNRDKLVQSIFGKKPDYAWECPLEDPSDYRPHITYEKLPVPAGDDGVYIVAVSADQKFSRSKNQVLAATVTISSLTMIVNPRIEEGELEVWVRDGRLGHAVAGVKVTVYQYDYNSKTRIHEALTDEHGLAKFPTRGLANSDYYYSMITAVKGNQFTLYKENLYIWPSSQPRNEYQAFVYTDRSIYRPLQKIYFKVVAYTGKALQNEYQVISGQSFNAQLVDPNGEVIAGQTITTNSYGSASGEFLIPSGRILGHYQVRVDGWGEAGIRVEEYKRPTFEAKLFPAEGALRLNQPAVIKGEARYYFGMPVTEGKVKYRITRETNYPWWYSWYYYWFTPQPAQEITAGETDLKNDGSFRISFLPEGDETLPDKKGVSFRFRITATVTDSGGETKDAVQDCPIGFVAVQATIRTGRNFNPAEVEIPFEIDRTNLSGTGQAGSGRYEVYLLKQPETTLRGYEIPLETDKGKHTKGDSLRPRWTGGEDLERAMFRWKDGPQVSAGNLEHDREGKGQLTLAGLKPGVYRLRYQTKDPWGALCQAQKEFLVFKDGMSINASHYLLAQKQQVYVGQKFAFLIGSGFKNKELICETWLGDKLANREYKTLDGKCELVSIPILEKMRGGFTLRLYLVEDYQVYKAEQWIDVPFNNKQLDVEFATFRDLLRPGQKETWSLTVKGPNQEKVSAEILAYMYDRSLDYFVKHGYPDPAALYRRWGYRPELSDNVASITGSGVSNYPWYNLPERPSLYDNGFIFHDSYPVGGLGERNYLGNKSMDFSDAVIYEAAPSAAASAPKKKNGGTEKAEEGLAAQDKVSTEKTPEQPEQTKEQPPRSNFAETAFFYPHLLTDEKGNVKIEFETPDSVTSWNVYAHALTKDLKFMTLLKQTETRKELMVRPYLPRFFREGDEAALKVVINNAGKEPMQGEAVIEIYDPETNQTGLTDFQLNKDQTKRQWSAPAGQSAVVTWKLTAPAQIKTYAFKVTARTKEFTDGEVRPVPVLPSRMHLVQSQFAALKDDETRTLRIEDMAKADSDPSLQNEKLVVTLDGQLIYTVLRALPYLVNYPYECMEQTMNRFLSTSIVNSLYDQYPPIAKIARDFSSRKTRLEPWALNDPNRKLALEETPWLQVAKGGTYEEADLINMFDTKVVKANQENALEKLRKAQLPEGGFPWFEGGPPSGYMTLYILYGFAKAREFNVQIPEEMTRRAWQYLRAEYNKYYASEKLSKDYYFLSFLNYVLSCFPESSYRGSFPENERMAILNRCFKHWKEFNPYTKAFLALTLNRARRTQDAKLVLASIMDSAITKKDQGTFWAREDRSWLWYNDTIESHAFILRTLLEIAPQDSRIDGLALWLLLNKKMNQWKSTRTTAEVIYSLSRYMQQNKSLAVREEAVVKIAEERHQFIFEPDQYTGGRNQVIIEGEKVKPVQMAKVTVDKKGKGFMFASTTWHYSTEKLPEEGRGDVLSVKRTYFVRRNVNKQYVLEPLAEGAKIQVGDQIEVKLSITCRNPMEYVHLHDPRAAGLEPERPVSGHHWDLGIYWYEEVRDSGANFFFEHLPQGEYTFKYRLRANMAGAFRIGPATLESMYAPEFAAFSAGQLMRIGE